MLKFFDKDAKIEISKIEDEKVFLKTNYNWAICLNAEYEAKLKIYYLPLTSLNFQKLKELFPNYKFPTNNLPQEKKNFELRPYQKEDVNFLSQQKTVAIFNEMRTGKTPTALAIFAH